MAKQTRKNGATNSAGKTIAASGASSRRSAVSGRSVKATTAVRNSRPASPGGTGVDPAQPASRMIEPMGHADVDEATIERLVTEAEEGIPEEKLRRRGRPSIGPEASSTFSVRLPDDLAALAEERSAMDGVSQAKRYAAHSSNT